jgi:hypothetical protein
MSKRTFFLGALLLAIAALITHSVARGLLVEYMHRKAEGISQAVKQHTTYVSDPRVLQLSRGWNVLTTIGIVLTVLSVVCTVTALVRREPGWYLILTLLLFFDLAAPMLL